MILIADIGSTKGDWCLVDGDKFTSIQTLGFNPYALSNEFLIEILKFLNKKIDLNQVKKLFYYGAGCNNPKYKNLVKKILSEKLINASIFVESDLLGACRAICGNKSGIVSILGTGSNSCLYDGKKIIKKIDSLGYLFGDEGSGFEIGKNIFIKYKRNELPKDLFLSFKQRFDKENDLLEKIYLDNNRSKLVSNFSKFVFENKHHPYIDYYINEHFTSYFNKILSNYNKRFYLNFCGSLAYYFKSYIKNISKKKEYKIGKIISKPIKYLSKYHSQ
tara:strand:- start:1684 stop:2508 length:825 start_codon:yes stop_codon:yes gene_type:complete